MTVEELNNKKEAIKQADELINRIEKYKNWLEELQRISDNIKGKGCRYDVAFICVYSTYPDEEQRMDKLEISRKGAATALYGTKEMVEEMLEEAEKELEALTI